MMERCADCKFALAFDNNKVHCRRFPPATSLVRINEEGHATISCNFPVMADHGWCGEFQLKVLN